MAELDITPTKDYAAVQIPIPEQPKIEEEKSSFVLKTSEDQIREKS